LAAAGLQLLENSSYHHRTYLLVTLKRTMPPRRRVQRQAEAHTKVESDTESKKRKRSTTQPSPRSSKRAHTSPEQLLEVEEDIEVKIKVTVSPTRTTSKRKASSKPAPEVKDEVDADEETPAKPKRKRKTQEEKEAEAMPLAARTLGLNMYVGAHTSIAKGVENAITNCVHIGGNAFACFLKSQRKWENPPLKDENRDAFHKGLGDHKYDAAAHIVPHGSYLVNLATEDKDKAKQSYDTFIDDLHRCEALGIRYYNFHPGGAGQSPFDEAIARLANNLNRALSETKTVVPLLENMAGHGTLIGGRFSDLRDVIALIKPEFKSRIGVCVDTCHAFAAGYDLRSPEAFKKTMADFDQTVGIKYLKALHLNDSKMPLSSHRDLHQNIGLGFLGLRAFHNVMNEPRFQGLPLILETPCERPDSSDPKGKKMIEDKNIWATEIKLLESLIGMDPQGEEFKRLERNLSEKGREEREKMQAQYERLTKAKADKEAKKLSKEREKGQKSLADMFVPKGNSKGTKGKPQPKKGKKKQSDDEESSELSELSDEE
jgi:AP endonuclease 1